MNWLRFTLVVFAAAGSWLNGRAVAIPPPGLPFLPNNNNNNSQFRSQPFWEQHLVRVNSTVQPYQFRHPWAKIAPFTKSGVGVALADGNVIVTADLLANHTYAEIESPQSGARSAAKVVRIDYDYNLALLHPESPLENLIPAELDLTAKPGNSFFILQLQSNGQLSATEANLTSTAVTLYPSETSHLLTFRVTAALQDRGDADTTLPVVRNRRLVGLIMRVDPRSQTYDVIPAQVIQQFLNSPAARIGVPRLGLSVASTRDPQLRRWLRLPESGGIYVCNVDENGPAAKAGIQRGDILFAIDNQPIDEQGDINDANFGKINFTYLISTKHHIGDEIRLKIFRNDNFCEKSATLDSVAVEQNLSPAYIRDRQPVYFILGGLVFMELSRPYLQEWGADWKIRAPQRLVYIDQYQAELSKFHGKIVFLSEVLPSKNTMGFDDLNHLIVTRVNGYPIHSLADVARASHQPIDGLQKIEFLEDPHLLYLDAASAAKTDIKLIKDYSIPATTNLPTP
ncbi:MAG: hypothetical protein C5B47_00515 [Verrucomicrobia bacterium]|nr:MAG: hypothetical protein C5B47_00515 [Verrucomicrobiota bacterium]